MKVFRVEDGEQHWFVCDTAEEAKQLYIESNGLAVYAEMVEFDSFVIEEEPPGRELQINWDKYDLQTATCAPFLFAHGCCKVDRNVDDFKITRPVEDWARLNGRGPLCSSIW